jgi:TldD protein
MPGKHGEFYFDHEGNLAKKTYLVKNGIINEPMADLYSKTELNLENSSNSRFESFDHKNYTRMSNTYFEAGSSSFDEMLSQIEDGIYICGSAGGMEDPKGWGVQIQGCSGIKIENGKLTDTFYDGFAITGFLPDIMKNISGVSKEFEIDGGGFCGKGHKEWVRVSEGGPYLLIDEVVLG